MIPRLSVGPVDSGPDPLVRTQAGTGTEAALHAAREAQRAFADVPEWRVDRLLAALADVIVVHAQSLAADTVQETGMGRVEDKGRKNVFAARGVADDLIGRVGSGIVGEDARSGVVEVARPVGVVLALLPVTNPVATLVFTALIALKSRNALLVRAHPRAVRVTERAVGLLRQALGAHGVPADLLQTVPGLDRHGLQELMRDPGIDLVLATGSSGLVRAAAESGTPTIGAGSGNAPAWIAADADVDRAAGAVVDSKSFDHGVICGSEQHLVVDSSTREPIQVALERARAAVLRPEDVTRLERVLFTGGGIRAEVLGRSPGELARCAGVAVQDGVRLLVAPLPAGAVAGPWGLERLVPVLGLHPVSGERAALELCAQFLRRGGAGHTAAVHTRSRERVMRFAAALPVGRVIVNGPASQGCIGMGNGLVPSLTLACGPVGGAVTTDNITYRHLQSITRIAAPSTAGPVRTGDPDGRRELTAIRDRVPVPRPAGDRERPASRRGAPDASAPFGG